MKKGAQAIRMEKNSEAWHAALTKEQKFAIYLEMPEGQEDYRQYQLGLPVKVRYRLRRVPSALTAAFRRWFK